MFRALLAGFAAYDELAREGYVAPLNARGARLYAYLTARRLRALVH
jgi:hypothetical protein